MRKMNNQETNNYLLGLYDLEDLCTVTDVAAMRAILDAQLEQYIVIDSILYTSAQMVKALQSYGFLPNGVKATYNASLPLLTMDVEGLAELFDCYGLATEESEASLTIIANELKLSLPYIRMILEKNNVDTRSYKFDEVSGAHIIIVGE